MTDEIPEHQEPDLAEQEREEIRQYRLAHPGVEETVIKYTRKGDAEVHVSTPELCVLCGWWLPIGDHLEHDLKHHMPKMPSCMSATRRTFTQAEREYYGGTNEPLRAGVERGDDPGRRKAGGRPGSHVLRRAEGTGPTVGPHPG